MKKLKENIYDYIKNYGCFNFTEKDFNEVDGMILSAFSYIDIETLKGSLQKEVTITNITKNLINMSFQKRRKYFLYDKDDELVKLMRISKRYGSLCIKDISSFFDRKNNIQFFAYTLAIKEGIECIVFRGTDKTLAGWKESFQLSYLDEVGSQKLAKEYLQNALEKNKKTKFYIVGHSKGGNLAIYSYMSLKNVNRIIKVYNYDGPGLSEKNNELLEYDKKSNLIINFVPKSSIIGMIFHKDKEVKVVDSRANGIVQHIHYTWLIEKDHFKFLKKRTKDSKIADDVINSWINSMTIKEKEEFIGIIFSWLTKSKAKETTDLLNIATIMKIIKQANINSKKTKESLSICFSKLVKESIKEVGKL